MLLWLCCGGRASKRLLILGVLTGTPRSNLKFGNARTVYEHLLEL
jgi:hypothetical protein